MSFDALSTSQFGIALDAMPWRISVQAERCKLTSTLGIVIYSAMSSGRIGKTGQKFVQKRSLPLYYFSHFYAGHVKWSDALQ